MKKMNRVIIGLILGSIMISGCSSNDTSKGNKVMTFESNISMTKELSNPSVNNTIQTIVLRFSEEIDSSTIIDGVKIYRIDSKNNPVEEAYIAKIDTNNHNNININNAEITSFTEGELYKIEISKSLRSTTGSMLENDYIGYFATNNNFRFSDSSNLNTERTQIIIISDLHLGIDDDFAEINKNRQALVNFLNQVKNSSEVKELIIAGDMLDEWFLPMDYQMPDSKADFFDALAANNQTVVDAFNQIISEGNIKVTYVPGNHDILLTAAEMERIFPGIHQVRDEVQGLGTYVAGENSEIAVEHGHKYNFFCAPDTISNRDITKNDSSVLPVGYFFTRIATSSVIEGHPKSDNELYEMIPNKDDEVQFNSYLYYQTWKGILSGLPVSERFSDKVIKTNVDGFTEDYSINDVLPRQNEIDGTIEFNLYKGIQETWDERQTNNGVKNKISAEDAIIGASSNAFTDHQAKTQFFDIDATIRIVIFGHTHDAKILPMKNLENEKTIYVNSGTWIDNAQGFPTMTFAVITSGKSDSALETVNLYQYSEEKTITQWQEAQAIIK